MSDILNPSEFNAMFSAALNGGQEAMEKLGEATGLYIQDKLRENSFARKILPPQTVTESELTRNVADEGLEYIDDIEPDSIAMRINWRGEPNRTYIEGKRYSIRISTIASERFQKSEQELRSYKMPLTKVIEQNTVKDIQEQIDITFMQHVKAAVYLATMNRMNTLITRGGISEAAKVNTADSNVVAAAGKSNKNFESEAEFLSYIFRQDKYAAKADTTGAKIDLSDINVAARPSNQAYYQNLLLSSEATFNRKVLRDLVKVQAARQMKARVFLMHENDWNDTIAWTTEDAGLQITSEIVKDGYKYTTVGGYTFVTTVRDNPEIIEPGQIFSFPSPEFLGRYLILENTKFWINKQGRFITMEAWEDAGIGFGNIKGIGCILLAGAQITLPAVFLDEDGTAAIAGADSAAGRTGYSAASGSLGGKSVKVVNTITADPSGGTIETTA